MTTGRAAPIDETLVLADRPVPEGADAAELRDRLARLLRLDQRLHWLAGEASDLGLAASWLRLEGVDDDIDQAIAAVRRELRAGDVPPGVPA
ncbi:MAG: hypothetical protein M3Q10_17155 [Chloroflexota bacterium]|nr:hypothetical protein [Chloroflexota bacterium]